MERIDETVHPIGHAHHIPTDPSDVSERKNAIPTRRIKSVKVATINSFISPAPLRIPSATSFVETTK